MKASSTLVRPTFASSFCLFAVLLFSMGAWTAEGESADLSFKIAPGNTAKYQWATTSNTETSGRENGEPFTFKADLSIVMNVIFKGIPPKGPGMRLAVRVENYAYNDKKSLGNDVGEIQASKGKIKVLQNGKAVVDSDNDIGLQEVKSFQQTLKSVEEGQMELSVEPNGKPVDEAIGNTSVIDTIHSAGADGMMRLLPGRELKPGATWEDSQNVATIATFKLAKPVVIRSMSTFVGWETKDGKRLAHVDLKTEWDNADLKGDNGEGLLVEISHVNGRGSGSCLFDPSTGLFVEGSLEASSSYRIDGKKDGQTTGLDVVGKSKFSFKQIP